MKRLLSWVGVALLAMTICFIVAAAPMILLYIGVGRGNAGCQREIVASSSSPDEARVAVVHENICSDGAFVTTLTSTVQIMSREAADGLVSGPHREIPKTENITFAVDTMRPEDRPVMRWVSSRTLQITVPNKSLIGLRREAYEGIQIIVQFDPDDPVERASFLSSLGLSE